MKDLGSFLLETIGSQPAAAARLLADTDPVREAAGHLRIGGRVYLVGTGTSFHGCLVGEHMLRSIGVDARAVLSFEFASYPPPARDGDVLIILSHRGTKRFTIDAAGGSRAAARILITGQGSPMTAGTTLRTVEQERSPVHTASHIGAMVRLAQLVAEVSPESDVARHLAGLPAAVGSAVGTGGLCAEVAAGLNLGRPLLYAGAGPGWASAMEGALKVREAAFVTAEAQELENLLHGPLISIDQSDTVFLIAQPGPSLERTREAAAALAEIGTTVVAVGPASRSVPSAAWAIQTPELPEALAPIVNVIPLQWIAYHASRARQVDADSFRRDDPRYLAAQARFTL